MPCSVKHLLWWAFLEVLVDNQGYAAALIVQS